MDNNYDYIVKTLLIGSSGVGKSSISNQFSHDKYDKQLYQTVGVDFKVKQIKLKEKIFKIHLWDTAGHERFRSITSSYYRGADCVIIVFDLNNLDSFNDLEFWLNEVKLNTDNILYYLVGNKSELPRKVDFKLIENLIVTHKINNYLEVSAKENKNIDKLFNNIVNQIYVDKIKKDVKIEEPILPPSLKTIKIDMSNNNKKKCC